MSHLIKNIVLFVKPIIWLVFIIVLCLMPVEDLPQTSMVNMPYFDKMVHFGMYFVLAVLLARPLKMVRLPVWMFALLISIFVGGVIEIMQFAITNYRSASWGDFGADFIGAVTGLLIYGWLVKGRQFEKYI